MTFRHLPDCYHIVVEHDAVKNAAITVSAKNVISWLSALSHWYKVFTWSALLVTVSNIQPCLLICLERSAAISHVIVKTLIEPIDVKKPVCYDCSINMGWKRDTY